MGFVATTLSIVDPVGALQRIMLFGRKLGPWENITAKGILRKDITAKDLLRKGIFYLFSLVLSFPIPYIFAIRYSPEDIKKRGISVNWDLMVQESTKIEIRTGYWGNLCRAGKT
jgi:hypothetical protein